MADDDDEPPGWKLFAELLRLWLPILLSICAITLTVVQSMATRRHARLSVQPRLEWQIEADDRAGLLALSLANVGLGPAILKTVSVVIDGEAHPLSSVGVCEDINRRIGRSADIFDTRCFVQSSERVVRAGDSLDLYRSQPVPAHAGDDHAGQSPDYRRFRVAGTYCSFYEDCWKIETP